MKNNSTPSEGWEERFDKLVKEFKDDTVWITHLIFKGFIQKEIAKARQDERREIAVKINKSKILDDTEKCLLTSLIMD